MTYRTTAPLVLVKRPGSVDYHYQGSFIPWLSDAQHEQLLAEGMVVEVDADEAPEPSGEGTRPKQTAPVKAWLDYRVSQGLDRTEAAALTKQELIDLGE